VGEPGGGGVSDTFLKDLHEGWAQLLAADGIGLTYPADPANGVGIYMLALPQTPDQLVSLSISPMHADPTQAESEFNLQVMCRSAGEDPRDVLDLDSAIFNSLAGRFPVTLPNGIKVSELGFLSGGSGGQDDESRWLWASRWQFIAYRPSTYRH